MKRYLFYGIIAMTLLAGIFIVYGMINVYQYAPKENERQAEQGLPNEKEREEDLDQPAQNDENRYRIIIAGDSVARGRGDQNGLGLAYSFPESVNEKPLDVLNIGVDGLVSSELFEIIRGPALEESLRSADLIVFSIGGNDLRRIAFMALQGEEMGTTSIEYLELRNSYLRHLQEVREYIRGKNTEVKIVIIGLFNPFESEDILEYLPRDLQLEILLDWNFQTQVFIEQDPLSVFLPTYDLFKWKSREYLSFDLIHPNTEGYRVLSDRIKDLL